MNFSHWVTILVSVTIAMETLQGERPLHSYPSSRDVVERIAGSSSEKQLIPPAQRQVFAFCNGVQPLRSGEDIRIQVKEEAIRKFLAEGKRYDATPTNIHELWSVASFQRPSSLNKRDAEVWDRIVAMQDEPRIHVLAEGVLIAVDKRILFWDLLNDRVLRLRSNDGETCLLLLP